MSFSRNNDVDNHYENDKSISDQNFETVNVFVRIRPPFKHEVDDPVFDPYNFQK